jgi:hypothetical protein
LKQIVFHKEPRIPDRREYLKPYLKLTKVTWTCTTNMPDRNLNWGPHKTAMPAKQENLCCRRNSLLTQHYNVLLYQCKCIGGTHNPPKFKLYVWYFGVTHKDELFFSRRWMWWHHQSQDPLDQFLELGLLKVLIEV